MKSMSFAEFKAARPDLAERFKKPISPKDPNVCSWNCFDGIIEIWDDGMVSVPCPECSKGNPHV